MIELNEREGRALTMAIGGDPDMPRTRATEAEIRKAAEILESCGRQLADDPNDAGEGMLCLDGARLMRNLLPFAAAENFVRSVSAYTRHLDCGQNVDIVA